ncbi:MAG: tetratricopeptide repeat protein [Candidatus Riflebacteria bacterium]|nr:tetratricopeptide repeat protein [Candidatus Riflebacteria bacterium]
MHAANRFRLLHPCVAAAFVVFALGRPGQLVATPANVESLQQIADEFDSDRAADRQVSEPLLALGERLVTEGRAREAVVTLQQAVVRHAGQPLLRGRALLALARAQRALRERSLARAALDLILRDGPAQLASEAQLEKALLESESLLSPERFLLVLRRLSVENPFTLDFDLLRYMVGTECGVRLDRVDLALAEFEKVWTSYPRGPKAPDALFHQALIEGLSLSKESLAWDRIEKLQKSYPSAAIVPAGLLLQGALAMAAGDHRKGLGPLTRIPDSASVASEALFLRGLACAYFLDDPEKGEEVFSRLEKVASGHWGQVALYHRALLAFAARKDPEAAKRLLAGVEPVSTASPRGRPRPEGERHQALLHTYRQQLESSISQVLAAKGDADREFVFASFWYGQHHFSRAVKELESFIEQYPTSPLVGRARLLLGKIQQEDVVDPGAARAQLDRAGKAVPQAFRGEIEWRAARSRQRDEGARQSFESIYHAGNDGASPFRTLAGVELAKEGALKEREKLELLKAVVRKEPSGDVRARLLSQLARAYRDAGNPRRALEVYQAALPFDPKLGAEIATTRTLLEIQDIEGRLARLRLISSTPGDASLLLKLGRLQLSLDKPEEAKKAFRAALKCLPGGDGAGDKATPRQKSGTAKNDRDEPEPSAGTKVRSAVADEVRLELMRLQVKSARFPNQALRYVKQYLDSVPDGPLRFGALEIKTEVLEHDFDTDDELVPLYRYLFENGYKKETFALKLARGYVKEKKLDQAEVVLTAVKFGTETGPEAGLVLAKVQEGQKKLDEASATYRRVALRWPETQAGREATQRHGAYLAGDLERGMAKNNDPKAFIAALSEFLTRMKPDWMGAVRRTVGSVGNDPYLSLIPLAELERLIDLIGASPAPDHRLMARFQGRAASIAVPPRGAQFKLDQGLSLAAAGDSQKAVSTLMEAAPTLPRALLHVAILQEEQFKDRTAALSRLDELLARTDLQPDDRVKAYLRKASLMTEDPGGMLEKALAGFPGGPGRAMILERLARLSLAKLPPGARRQSAAAEGARPPAVVQALRRAGELYQAASACVSEFDERVRLTLEGARAFLDAGAYELASRATKQLSQQALKLELEPDPSPLKEYDRAQAMFQQILGFFPQAAKDEVERLRREMSHRSALKSLEEKEDKLPRDLMQLAVSLEEDLGDYASAALDLRELLARHPGDPLALIARFRLIRLYALHLDRRDDAARLTRGLADVKEAKEYGPEIQAAINLVVAQEKYVRARAAAEAGARSDPRGSPELIAALSRMGKVAVEDFRDQALAAQVLRRIVAYADGPAAADARREGYRLAIAAGVELSPLRAAVYALSERAGFLKTALAMASTGEERARVLLEQGLDHQREQEGDEAARAYDGASREAPASPFGREALLRLAQLHDAQKSADKARDAYARLAKSEGPETYVKLASKQLPRLEGLARSRDREIQLAQAERSTPSEYYNVAKQQLEEDDDLEGALTNLRTYLRVGREQKRLVDACILTAELLARLNRPKEGVDTLERAMARFPRDGRISEMVYKLGQLKEVQLVDLKGAEEEYKRVKRQWAGSKWAAEADKSLKRLAETRKERQRAKDAGSGKSTVASDIRAIRKKYIGEKGSYEEAIAAIKGQLEATTAPGEKAALHLELATIYDKELKNYPEAVASYEQYLGLATDLLQKGDIHLRVAELKAQELKEPEEALTMYQDFSNKFYNHPKRIDAMLAMARLQEKQLSDVQAAINIYRNIADSYPRSGYDEQARMRIAELSRNHFADYPGAVAALRRLVRDYPFSNYAPFAQLQIANILEIELGDKQAAATEYQRLIDAYPQSPYADGARQALIRIRGR